MEYIPFNLEEIIMSLSNFFSIKTEEKHLELLFDIDERVPYELLGDPLRLNQVLINLINNAIKFTEKGEVVIKIYLNEKSEPEGQNQIFLLFSVLDSGIGMTREQVEKLFQSFSQGDSSTTRKYGGTGLGLAISKSLVEMMGGEISASSEYGKGSVFSFSARLGLNRENSKA